MIIFFTKSKAKQIYLSYCNPKFNVSQSPVKDNKGEIGDFGLSHHLRDKSLTGCVVTRWYRAPELLLKERRYDTAIDMWAIRCVFGEMLKGSPILRGRSDQDQLDLIFKLCGTPTEEDWPD
ncbi:3754_t:CDS:2 [Diversispora eburnea]|uniref:3754_t:CDS:1 n=1 Tax=Diversispora eburnea TaxID=1213867 RepID=A0A9N8VAK3_9GLOM|nr:3754_t:CDS:2 [Diversispora eburnea]